MLSYFNTCFIMRRMLLLIGWHILFAPTAHIQRRLQFQQCWYRTKEKLLLIDAHGRRILSPQFSGVGLFRGPNHAHNHLFEGYMVKGICSQNISVEQLNSQFFYFRPFSAIEKLQVDVYTDMMDWVKPTTKIISKEWSFNLDGGQDPPHLSTGSPISTLQDPLQTQKPLGQVLFTTLANKRRICH